MSNQKLSRREALSVMAAGAFAGMMTREKRAHASERPNVLFIAVDDLRPQLGCYGRRQTLSPNIDRLAAEGTLFERAYCQVPVCGASRASLLTGLRPTRERFINYMTRADRDAPDVPTLPEHFRRNGYHTVSLGKIFHHEDDSLESWTDEPWQPETGSLHWITEASKQAAEKNARSGRGPAYESAEVPDDAYPDGMLCEWAITELERLSEGDEPFFLAAGFYRPHLPFNAPQKYWDLYPHEEIDLADNPFRPKGAPDIALHNWGELRQYAGIPQEGPLDDETARTLIHGYYACVSYTDAQIGRLLDKLETLGLADNTVVVLWGDHGWQLGEHGLWCKHCNFETSLHSPLIVRAPGMPAGQSTEALVEFLDIYPSLTELCGLARPEHLQGKSFAPLLDNPRQPWKDAAFSRFEKGDSIRTDRYHYVEYRDDNGETIARMLYDHETDPHENVNIAAQAEHAELVQRLSRRLYQTAH